MIIADFIRQSPAGAGAVMQILSIAESLTDDVAKDLYGLVPITGLEPDLFLFALHQSNLIEARNSEWSFPLAVRSELRALAVLDSETLQQAHAGLLKRGLEADVSDAGSKVPSYLLTDAGKAYHSAYAGHIEDAMQYYREVATRTISNFSGVQWLASRFATEQQEAAILPSDSVELIFLRAMTFYRDGRRDLSLPLFRKIAAENETNQFTAVACDIVGVAMRRRDRTGAEALFRRAAEIAREIGNRTGEGVHIHNLAQVLPKTGRAEAEALFRSSLAIAEEQHDDYSAAIRKNGLGDLLAHTGRRHHAEAETLLREAMNYFQNVNDEYSRGAPMTTLARLLAMDGARIPEAEDLYRRAITIAREQGDSRGLSIRLSGLAKLLKRSPEGRVEARSLLRENLDMLDPALDATVIRKLSQMLDEIDLEENTS